VIGGFVRPRDGRPLGVYVHLPYCARRCEYCDYPVVEGTPEREGKYLDALVRELEERGRDFDGRSLRTIYFGGGTPSAVPTNWIGELAGDIRERGSEPDPTVTLEVNPEDVREGRLEGWREAGVDRLIVGIQSLQKRTLERLGRTHSPEQSRVALRRALGSDRLRVGADLVFGVRGQTVRSWRSDLEELVEDYRSLRGLYLYEYTGEGDDRNAPERSEVSEIDRMFRVGLGKGRDLGLNRTGVASLEGPEFASRHTHGYRSGWEYLGLGMAASSLSLGIAGASGSRGPVRRRNAASLGTYIEDPTGSASAREPSAGAYFATRLAAAMRTFRGLDWGEVREQFAGAVSERSLRTGREFLEELIASGRARARDGRIRPTDAGFDVADAIDREARRRLVGGGPD